MTVRTAACRAIFAALAAVAFLVPSALAASPDLILVHPPMPVGVRGQALLLAAAVASDCGVLFCSGVEVSLEYRTIGESSLVQRVSLAQYGGAAQFTIPGNEVRNPGLEYVISVSQSRCSLFGSCESGSARWPAQGWQSVVVAG